MPDIVTTGIFFSFHRGIRSTGGHLFCTQKISVRFRYAPPYGGDGAKVSTGGCDPPDFGSIPNHRPIRLFSLKEKHVPHTDGDAASRTAGGTRNDTGTATLSVAVPVFRYIVFLLL